MAWRRPVERPAAAGRATVPAEVAWGRGGGQQEAAPGRLAAAPPPPAAESTAHVPPGVTVMDIDISGARSREEQAIMREKWDATVLESLSYGTQGTPFKCAVCHQTVQPSLNFGRWNCWREIRGLRFTDSFYTYYVKADHLHPEVSEKAFYEVALMVDAALLRRVTELVPMTAPVPQAVISPPHIASVVDQVSAARMSVARYDSRTHNKAMGMRNTAGRMGGRREDTLMKSLRHHFEVTTTDGGVTAIPTAFITAT